WVPGFPHPSHTRPRGIVPVMSIAPENNRDGSPVDKGTLEAQIERIHSADDDAPRALSPEAEKRLWRKVDLRLMPILSLMYLLSFMDRGNAKLDGLTTQLYLIGDRYNIALVRHFILCVRIPLLIRVTDHVFHGAYSVFVLKLAFRLVPL
ncbi:hypothetical protein J3R82DRAFT_8321, partial [Butyriboletus roseoflavus]